MNKLTTILTELSDDHFLSKEALSDVRSALLEYASLCVVSIDTRVEMNDELRRDSEQLQQPEPQPIPSTRTRVLSDCGLRFS